MPRFVSENTNQQRSFRIKQMYAYHCISALPYEIELRNDGQSMYVYPMLDCKLLT